MDARYGIVDFDLSYLDEIAEAEEICFPNDHWSRESFAETAENESFCLTLIKNMQTTKIAAYSLVYCAADQADLANIAVLPECRGQGLGKHLLEITLEKVHKMGACEIFLEVRESNAAARGLYLSSGFVEIGKRKKYYSNPREDAVIMICKL